MFYLQTKHFIMIFSYKLRYIISTKLNLFRDIFSIYFSSELLYVTSFGWYILFFMYFRVKRITTVKFVNSKNCIAENYLEKFQVLCCILYNKKLLKSEILNIMHLIKTLNDVFKFENILIFTSERKKIFPKISKFFIQHMAYDFEVYKLKHPFKCNITNKYISIIRYLRIKGNKM